MGCSTQISKTPVAVTPLAETQLSEDRPGICPKFPGPQSHNRTNRRTANGGLKTFADYVGTAINPRPGT
jgi:hypothetical protein